MKKHLCDRFWCKDVLKNKKIQGTSKKPVISQVSAVSRSQNLNGRKGSPMFWKRFSFGRKLLCSKNSNLFPWSLNSKTFLSEPYSGLYVPKLLVVDPLVFQKVMVFRKSWCKKVPHQFFADFFSYETEKAS